MEIRLLFRCAVRVCREKTWLWLMFLLACLLAWVRPVLAQDEADLELRISRTMGYSSGSGRIQGLFKLKAAGPADLARVAFFVDDQQIGTDEAAPFEQGFSTDNYGLGMHTLYAVGVTSGGRQLRSNEVRVEFVSAQEGWQAALRIMVPILALTFGIMVISYIFVFLAGKKESQVALGAPRHYGIAGGAICPRCKRPFSMHLLAPNMALKKYDRCPFCGKWSLVRPETRLKLQEAEAAELQLPALPVEESDGDRLKKDLENSRYTDL